MGTEPEILEFLLALAYVYFAWYTQVVDANHECMSKLSVNWTSKVNYLGLEALSRL